MRRKRGCLALILGSSVLVTAGFMPALARADSETGQKQLIDALDAAWVRVLDDGTYRSVVNKHGMGDVIINISDCLPNPEFTPFPEAPEGALRRILKDQAIKVGYSNSGQTGPGDSATYFTQIGEELLAAMLDRVASHYETGPIKVITVNLSYPFDHTTALNDRSIDIVGQVNALGGISEDRRRRTSRRFTCIVSGSPQVLWVNKTNGPDWESVDDALNDPTARVCAGPLSNQLAKAYFDLPGQKSTTAYLNDMQVCLTKLVRGEVDAMLSPFPDSRFFPARLDSNDDGALDTASDGRFRSIPTYIVAGTPFWAAID
jgi:ABC-type amino acid transport substrate-binding protein